MRDLFYDLRDGTSLLALLEVLSGERLVSSSNPPILYVLTFLVTIVCALLPSREKQKEESVIEESVNEKSIIKMSRVQRQISYLPSECLIYMFQSLWILAFRLLMTIYNLSDDIQIM